MRVKNDGMAGGRREVCVQCGLAWGVSRLAQVPAGGYVCPWCREKALREGGRRRRGKDGGRR